MSTYQPPMQVHRLMCCGWRELHGIQYYRGDFDAVLKNLMANGVIGIHRIYCGVLLFTDVGGGWSRYAKKFAKDIQERGLGDVVRLPVFTNPNTNRRILAHTWHLNGKAVIKYCKTNNLFPKAYPGFS
jgi:hypothetical protein